MRQQTGENRVLVPDVAVSRVRKRAEILGIFFVLGKELRNLRGLFVRRRLEHHHVNQAEDRRVYPDAERKHRDGGDREPRRFP